jgi:hypothetical protein
LVTILEKQLPLRLNIRSEVITHLESLEDHQEVHGEEHCTGKPE